MEDEPILPEWIYMLKKAVKDEEEVGMI